MISHTLWPYAVAAAARIRGRTSLTVDEVVHVPFQNAVSGLLQKSLVMMQSVMGDKDFATMLAQYERQQQLRFLALLALWHDHNPTIATVKPSGSILDSGSGRHVSSRVKVTNTEPTPLKGFNQSVSWSKGSGELVMEMMDTVSGKPVQLKVENVDMIPNTTENILSMGLLLKAGWDFHLTNYGKDNEAISPDGKMRFPITLSPDGILRWEHDFVNAEAVTDNATVVGVTAQCNLVSRQNNAASAVFLHEMFYHASDEVVYQSILRTHGYVAQRLPKFHCSHCALANARKKGLSHKYNMASQPVFALLDADDYGDTESLSSGDSDSDDGLDVDDVPTVEAKPVVFKREPLQHRPRFDLAVLRPFEVMMVDNKDFPCYVRNGFKTAFISSLMSKPRRSTWCR